MCRDVGCENDGQSERDCIGQITRAMCVVDAMANAHAPKTSARWPPSFQKIVRTNQTPKSVDASSKAVANGATRRAGYAMIAAPTAIAGAANRSEAPVASCATDVA